MNAKILSAIGGALLVGATGAASAAEPQVDLSKQVQALQTRVAELEAKQGSSWLNDRRAEEIKALVQDVLADADQRASLSGAAVRTGYQGGFRVANEDGSFLLQVNGLIQLRYILNSRDGSEEGGNPEDDCLSGFEINRANLAFSGHIASPRITYALQLAVDRTDNSVSADRIVLGYQLTDGLALWAGEDKAPFLREELVADGMQMAVERSAINEFFTIGTVQGIGAVWTPANIDMLKVSVAISDGIRSGESDDAGQSNYWLNDNEKAYWEDDNDYAITARVDVKVFGAWDQMNDFTAWGGENMALVIGGAIHYDVGDTGNTGDNDSLFMWTVDASLEVAGLSVYGAFVMAHPEWEDGGESQAWGAIGQVAYNINDQCEPFARIEFLNTDVNSDGGDTTIVTLGANWYNAKHSAKFTADVVWALDPIVNPGGQPISAGATGLLTDGDNNDNQLVLRLQYQLGF